MINRLLRALKLISLTDEMADQWEKKNSSVYGVETIG